MVVIGKAQYEGTSAVNQQRAQENAASIALLHVQALDEESLRSNLGLPHRNHISELDHVRDCLRQLKRRYKDILGNNNTHVANNLIGKLYQDVDRAEVNLMTRVGLYD